MQNEFVVIHMGTLGLHFVWCFHLSSAVIFKREKKHLTKHVFRFWLQMSGEASGGRGCRLALEIYYESDFGDG